MSRIVAVGAEVQAASSLALAYGDREILFISDQPVLDGWDFTHVHFARASPHTWRALVGDGDAVVPMSARWMVADDWSLTRTLSIAAAAIGVEHVERVHDRPDATGMWQAKGNRWHRPDTPVDGPGGELAELTDPHGCGVVFQQQLRTAGTVMTIGRFGRDGAALGVFRVFEERFFRDVILQAAETISDAQLVERSAAIASALHLDGFCTMNWVLTDAGARLTSLRPVPRAVFVTFRRGGIDPLAASSGTTVLPAGLRLNAQPHYASYRPLPA